MAVSQPFGWSARVRTMVLLGVAVWALRLIAQFLPATPHAFLADCTAIVTAGLAAVSMGLAARRCADRPWPWRLLALALLCWTVADILWLLLAWVIGDRPWGSLADVFFLAFYPLLLGGIFLLPRQSLRRHDVIILLLDLSIASIGMLIILTTLVIGPTLADASDSTPWWSLVIALAYPTGDLLALWATMVLLVVRLGSQIRRTGQLIAVGACILIVADTIYAAQVLQGTYVSGNWLGLLWHAAMITMAIGGSFAEGQPVDTAQPPTGGQRKPAVASLVLAFVCLIAAWFATAQTRAPGFDLADVGIGGMLLLVLLRLAVGLIDNRHLNRELFALNRELDLRVAQRTTSLESAHHALQMEMDERLDAERRLRESEEKLEDARRLESLGRLAGGIAHDVNNLLAAIGGHAELLIANTEPQSKSHIWAERIDRAVQRGSGLTRQLVAFGRREAGQNHKANAGDLAREVVDLLPGLLPASITATLVQADLHCWVHMDPVQLHQILLNLSLNARNAMRDGGVIEITVQRQSDAGGTNVVELGVADRGCGISPDVRRRIFEPFFTTNATGTGSGLGLSVVHSLVTAAHGDIIVEDRDGGGTCFTIRLPEADDGADDDEPRTPQIGTAHAKAIRVLVVDDEDIVRHMVEDLLKEGGFAVTSCADAATAIEHASNIAPHLLVTDATMPEMDGYALVARLRASIPDLPVVMISGWSTATTDLGTGSVCHLDKPFRREDLLDAVAKVLQRPSTP